MRKLKLTELGRDNVSQYKTKPKIPVVIVLDNIRSALNVGSVFRTSDAYLIEKIHLCGITAKPPHKEITKSAIGATESVVWFYEPDVQSCIEKLKSDGYLILGIEQTDQSSVLQDFKIDSNNKYAIVFGNEVNGISESILPLLDAAIELPQYGTKHSLNISVCAGVVIWEFWKGFGTER